MSDRLRQSLQLHLSALYSQADAPALIERILDAFWPGKDQPRQDPKADSHSLWSEQDSILITYGDSIYDPAITDGGGSSPLRLLDDFLTDTVGNAISSVHILPFFPASSDDGFAVIDYRQVNPPLGTWKDVTSIGYKYRLMADLVINHASSQSEWFEKFKKGEPPYDNYFYTGDPYADHSEVVRPRPSPLLMPVETSSGIRHVWCTFSHDQVDLNFAYPEVLLEFIRIMRFYIDRNVRLFRLDAVAFLWKEPGTRCINLPQTHEIIKLLRALVNHTREDVVLITETNIPNHENLSYFGNQNEAHIIYNFSLPPLITHALLSGDSTYLCRWMMSMPPALFGCAYLNFTASHDGIGLRPAEGLLPEAELQRMIDTVQSFGAKISMRSTGNGESRPYEMNVSLFDALKGSFEGPDEFQIDRFLASQTIMMSLEGIPAFYIHSLLATPNDEALLEETGRNRSINRHRWNLPELSRLMADPGSPQSIVSKELLRRLEMRIRQPAFHPNAVQFTLHLAPGLFGFWRQSMDRRQSIFVITNLTIEEKSINLHEINLIAGERWVDLLSGDIIGGSDGDLTLRPYQTIWITNRSDLRPRAYV